MKYFAWALFILICVLFPSVLLESARSFSDGEYTFDDLKYGVLLVVYALIITRDARNIFKYGDPL